LFQFFCIAAIPDPQSAGGGEESVQAKAAGATLHLQAGGPLEARRKIREKITRHHISYIYPKRASSENYKKNLKQHTPFLSKIYR
jgi:hypothetical protein